MRKLHLNYCFPLQTATEVVENIRTVAGLTKEQHFADYYDEQIDKPFRLVYGFYIFVTTQTSQYSELIDRYVSSSFSSSTFVATQIYIIIECKHGRVISVYGVFKDVRVSRPSEYGRETPWPC